MNGSTSGSTAYGCLRWSNLNPLLLIALIGVILALSQQSSAVPPEESSFEVLGPDIEDLSWTPGVAPTAIEAELEDVTAPRKGYIYAPGLSPGFDYALDHLDRLEEATGL